MYGKRIVEWEGSLDFHDEKNSITAKLNFTPAPKFFQKFKEPTDVFRGEIKKDENVINKLYGSPLDKLMIDNEVYSFNFLIFFSYWELDTVDILQTVATTYCIPSDCRYRTDTICLAEGDLKRSESEKLRLEVIQRADRALRDKNKKH